MSSYQQNPDVNSYAVQPYQLPAQEIMGALNAKSAYYQQGLDRFRQRYQQAFDMNLTNEQNIQSLNQQRQNIDDQLRKKTSKDLSIGTNQQQLLDTLKPIMTNRNYLADEQITSRINNGMSQAEGDGKNKGYKYYNALSVQVLNGTKEQLRNQDISSDNWWDSYMQNSLMTTYQPYDPSVKDDALKQLKSSIKTYKKETPTSVGGTPYIVTTEGKELNGVDAIEYVNSFMPEQERTQNQLRSILDYRNGQQKIQESNYDPHVVKAVNDEFTSMKNYSIQRRENAYQQIIDQMQLQRSLLPDSDSRVKKYDGDIAEYQTKKDGVRTALNAEFDDNAYADHGNPTKAMEQMTKLYNDRWNAGVVDGLGIGETTTTYRPDNAQLSMMNYGLNVQRLQEEQDYHKLSILAKSGVKYTLDANGKLVPATAAAPGGGWAGGNLSNSDVVTDPTLTHPFAEQKRTELASKTTQDQLNIIKQVTGTLLPPVNDGKGNYLDVFSYMQLPEHANMTFKEVLDKFDGDENTKNTLRALVSNATLNTSAKTGGRNNAVGDWTESMKIPEAINRLKFIFSDKKVYDALATKLGVDFKNMEFSNNLASSMELSKNEDQQNLNQYKQDYVNAGRAIGWDLSDVNDPSIFSKSKLDYVTAMIPQLKQQGMTDKDIHDLTQYAAGKLTKTQLGQLNPRFASIPLVTGSELTALHQTATLPIDATASKVLNSVDEKWDTYNTALTENLSKNAGVTSNVQTKQYNIWSPYRDGSKSFDPTTDKEADQVSMLLNEAAASDANGKTIDPNVMEGLKTILTNQQVIDANYFPSVKINNDGTVYLGVNMKADWSKLPGLAHDGPLKFNMTWEEWAQKIASTPLHISAQKVQEIFGKPTLGAEKVDAGYKYNLSLPSTDINGKSNSFSAYKSAQGLVVKAQPVVAIPLNNGTFRVDQQNITATDDAGLGVFSQRPWGMTMRGVENNIPYAYNAFRYVDNIGKYVSDLVKQYQLQPNADGTYNFKDFPQNVQNEIKQTTKGYF